MTSNSTLSENLATLGIVLPAWPDEPEVDSASGDWIQRGKAYAAGVRLWRAQLGNAPESTKGVVDQLVRHLQDIASLGVWDQLVYSAIKPEVQGSPDYERWKASTKLIRLSELTPAQLLGIAIDQAENGYFENARRGLNRLSEEGLLDQALTKDLCLNVLYGAADNLPRVESVQGDQMSGLIDKHISFIKLIRELINYQSSTRNDDNNYFLNVILQSVANPVVILAGMRHSASTALFNAVRIGFKLSGRQISANYSEYFDISSMRSCTGMVYLTKIHEYRHDHCQCSDYVITTRRDLRDSVASAKRRGFSLLDKVGGTVQYAAYNRSLHEAWHDKSDLEISYDHFIDNPVQTIKDVFELLGINPGLAVQVAEAIKTIPTNNYSVTLLSSTHITDPNRELVFRDTLASKDITAINERNKDWLQRYSYI